jgi:hypothetical protein
VLYVDLSVEQTEQRVREAFEEFGASRVEERAGSLIGERRPSGLVRALERVVVDLGAARVGEGTYVSVQGRFQNRSWLHFFSGESAASLRDEYTGILRKTIDSEFEELSGITSGNYA